MLLRQFEMPWRTAYEGYAALAWFLCLIGLYFAWHATKLPDTPFYYLAATAAGFLFWNLARSWEIWRLKWALGGKGISFISDRTLSQKVETSDGTSLWFGKGFDWTPMHTQRVYEIKRADPKNFYPPAAMMWLMEQWTNEQVGAKTPDFIGAPWVHGINGTEEDLFVPIQNLIGNTLLVGTTRCGKAQPLDAKVHTPAGWRLMGDMKVGDSVSTPDGTGAKVIGVFPQGTIPIYRITFADGRSAEACGEHLWEIHHKHWRGKYRPGESRAGKAAPRIMTTLQLMDQMARNKGTFKVRLPEMVEKPNANLPIDPYVLGCFLGDGLLGKGMRLTFCNEALDVIERIKARLPKELALVQNGPRPIDYSLQFSPEHSKAGRLPGGSYSTNPYKAAFKAMGLNECRAWEKFIPSVYKDASVDQRLEVLRGLMDTDGEVSAGRRLNFYTSSPQLAADVQELVWSLGGYAKIHDKQTHFLGTDGKTKAGRPSYRVAISHPNPRLFLTHQARLARLDGRNTFRNRSSSGLAITSIEYVRDAEAQCIAIDHHDHLYITDNYVVTHNTRFLELIASMAIKLGYVVISIDPKGDVDYDKTLKAACKMAGREADYVKFHLAFPGDSVRIDPLKNYTNPSDLASRIAALMPGGDKSSSFRDFAWGVLNAITLGMLATGEKPTLVGIRSYVDNGVAELLMRVTLQFFDDELPANWEIDVAAYARTLKQAKGKKGPEDGEVLVRQSLHLLLDYYVEVIVARGLRDEAIESLATIYKHDSAHYGKMIANLVPILGMLTTGELGQLLSPNARDINDARPMTDLASLIRAGAVVSIGLDSLANKTISSAVGSMLLSDLTSVAAAFYNYGYTGKKIFLIVDEAAEVVNDPYIQMLNKSAGAGFINVSAIQTIPDLAARFESMDKARQMLGNFNNLVSMRIKDRVTQDFVTETFGETYVYTKQVIHGTSSSTEKTITHFTGSVQERVTEALEDVLPTDILGQLPNWQYIAAVSGGRLIKGRLPIVTHE